MHLALCWNDGLKSDSSGRDEDLKFILIAE